MDTNIEKEITNLSHEKKTPVGVLANIFKRWYLLVILSFTILISGLLAFNTMPKRDFPVIDIPLTVVTMETSTVDHFNDPALANTVEFEKLTDAIAADLKKIDPTATITFTMVPVMPVFDETGTPTALKSFASLVVLHDYITQSVSENNALRTKVRDYIETNKASWKINPTDTTTASVNLQETVGSLTGYYMTYSRTTPSDAGITTGAGETTDGIILKDLHTRLNAIDGVSKVSINGLYDADAIAKTTNNIKETHGTVTSDSSIVSIEFKDGIDIRNLQPEIDAALAANKKAYEAQGLQEKVFVNKISDVNKSVGSIFTNLIVATIIVAIVVLIILGYLNALNVAVTLPIIIFGTLLINYLLGLTFEIIMMSGVIITIGMVVDNAIVIAEDVEARKEAGEHTESAIINTIKANWIPVLGATFTTIAAFVPLMLLPGIAAAIVKTMTITVVVAIALSYLSALFFVPAFIIFVNRVRKKMHKVETDQVLKQPKKLGNLLFTKGFYARIGKWSLMSARKSFIVLPVILVLLVGTFMLPKAPSQTTAQDVNYISVKYGTNTVGQDAPVKLGDIRDEIISILDDKNSEIGKSVTSYVYSVSGDLPSFGQQDVISPTESAGRFLISTNKNGSTMIAFETLLNETLNDIDEIKNIAKGNGSVKASALLQGAASTDLSITVTSKDKNHLQAFYDKIDADYLSKDEYTADYLSLTYSAMDPASPVITKSNGEYSWAISGFLREGKDVAKLQDALNAAVVADANISIQVSGSAEAQRKTGKIMMIGGMVALGIIAMIGIIIFRSIKPTVIMMLTLPATFIGVNIVLWLAGQPLDTNASIGVIALAGIVVNNSILLLDRFKTLAFKEGVNVVEASNRAVKDRIRPIIISNLTTVLGLLPLALGTDAFFIPLAWTMIGGIIANALLCVFIVPSFLRLFYFKKFSKGLKELGDFDPTAEVSTTGK